MFCRGGPTPPCIMRQMCRCMVLSRDKGDGTTMTRRCGSGQISQQSCALCALMCAPFFLIGAPSSLPCKAALIRSVMSAIVFACLLVCRIQSVLWRKMMYSFHLLNAD